MNLQHVNVKLFVVGELNIDLERFIEVFHAWVAGQTMSELLIDVADYRHVPAGPAVVLVGLEADYVMDNTGARMGVLYNRKAAIDGSNGERLRQSLSAALAACERLESEFPGLQFDRGEFDITINDRASAPNAPETYQALESLLDEFIPSTLGQSDFTVKRHDTDSRRLCGVTVGLAGPIKFKP